MPSADYSAEVAAGARGTEVASPCRYPGGDLIGVGAGNGPNAAYNLSSAWKLAVYCSSLKRNDAEESISRKEESSR